MRKMQQEHTPSVGDFLRMWAGELLIVFLLFALLGGVAYADNDSCRQKHRQCGHNHDDGEQGPPGPQGEQGEQGSPGIDGIDGRDGRDGRDGVDGIVPTEWIIETRNNHFTVNRWYREVRDAAAAQAAMQVHLSQNQNSRLTLGISRLNSVSGYALGYAYVLDNDRNTALTIAVGVAGDETAAKASFGFEFGGNRRMEAPTFVPAAVPPPEYNETASKLISHDEYHSLMAEVQREEFEEQQQMVADKFAQYDNLIEANQQQKIIDDEEIERLKWEAVNLRAAEKKREDKEAARRAAARAYLEKEDENVEDESDNQ